MTETRRFLRLLLPTENHGSAAATPLSQKKKRGPVTPHKKTEGTKEETAGALGAQIEKHLNQAIHLHKNLWQATQNSLIEIEEIVELLRSSCQAADTNAPTGTAPNEKNEKKSGQEAKREESSEARKHLEVQLMQRLHNLKLIKKLLCSPDFMLDGGAREPAIAEMARSKKILIVDDDPISIKLTGHFLQKADFSVTCAVDGKEGLQKALENPPDIILIDIMMPGLDGYQLLTQLKKEAATSRIPVLILSSLRNEQEIIRGLKDGAVDFITKPFSPQVLLAKLEKFFTQEK